ncbi:MAG: hypothetical protein WC043_10880 [Pseudobdellovibrionaceae bacterium]
MMLNRAALCLFLLLCPMAAYAAVPAIPFTVTMSEAVNVTGSPRIVLDVDGNTRYAVYAAGTGTASLTFTYTATAGDVDLNGIGIASTSVDLNGGTVTDLNGNTLSNLTFTSPANMASVNVNYPSLSMDFTNDADGRYSVSGTVYNDLTSFLTATGGTFTRASTATYFDSTGALQTAAINTPRFDYDPVSHAAKGILIEESRTNSLKNSQFSGAAVGVVPAHVVVGNGGSGITAAVTAVGTANGENYMEVTFTGTSTGASTIYPNIFFTPAMADLVPAAQGQTWTGRIHIISDTGTSPNNMQIQIAELDSSNNYLNATNLSTSSGSYQSVTRTLTSASTAYIRFIILTSMTNGQTINRTLRFSVPQLEQGAFPTSYIPTTTTAVTRSADRLFIPVGAWFSGTTGTWNAYFDGGRESTQGSYGRVVAFNGGATALSTDCGATTTVGTWNGTSVICRNTGTDYYTTAGGAASAYDEGSMTRSLTGRGLAPTTGAYTGTYVATGNIGLGGNVGSATNMLNGHIQKMRYYPSRASDTQLQLLTQ